MKKYQFDNNIEELALSDEKLDAGEILMNGTGGDIYF
jgi:hypothetical protein